MKDFLKWFENEYEGQKEVYERYPEQIPTKEEFKYTFLSDYVFDVITYDESLSYQFGKKIFEVIKAIDDRKTFDYIRDEKNYVNYILVCNLLDKFELIEWGTSIRGTWWSAYEDTYIKCSAGCWDKDGNVIYEDPTITIKELIKWIEEK